jgi:hypothetical protein
VCVLIFALAAASEATLFVLVRLQRHRAKGTSKMHNPKYPLLALGAYLALVGIVSVTSSKPAQAQGQRGPDVRVVNSAAEPVPVRLQGAAEIDTTHPIPVRDVENAGRQPISMKLERGGPFNRNYFVPAGKRLVIEYVAGRALITGGTLIHASLNTPSGEYPFPLHFADEFASGLRVWIFAQTTRIYADPGDEVTASYLFGHIGTSEFVVMQISGYLTDVP